MVKDNTLEYERDPQDTGIPIKNATSKGYIMAYDGDGIDFAYPNSKARRGRVQPQRSQTVQTVPILGVVLLEKD